MFNFPYLLISQPENSVLYAGSYDPILVCLSIAVAVFASYAALLVSQHISTSTTATTKFAWITIGGLCLGVGIWAMHFVGMLAFNLPCSSSFDPALTFLSTIPGILASGLALIIISKRELSHSRLAVGGLLLGVGISAMHYSGMAAMRLNGLIRYDIKLFLLSILVAIIFATAALWVKFRMQSWQGRWNTWITIASATMMGLAISGMHYTAMAAAYFVRADGTSNIDSGIAPSLLAAIVLVIASLIIVGAIVGTYVGKPNLLSFGRSKKLLGLLLVCWGVFSWLSADYYYEHFANELFQRESKLASQQAESIVSNIDYNIEMLKGISLMYAHDAETYRVLRRFEANTEPSPPAYDERKQRWTQDKALGKLNNILALETTQLGADLIFILNAAGDCIVASNAGKPGSPVGTNYADREYFPLARAGQTGHQYAVGRTTNVPGLYYVSPVFQAGRFLGAVVVKRDVTKFARWTDQADAFISDANGVIILAPDKNLELRTLPDAAAAKLPKEEILLQYKRSALESLKISAWDNARFPSAVRLEGKDLPVLLSSRRASDNGLSIHVPRPLDEFVRLGTERNWLFFLLAAAGSMLIVAASAVVIYLRETQRKEAITETFGKYVDPRIVKKLIEDHQFSQNGDKRNMTVFFCDLEGFTAITEKFDAESVVKLLNRYFSLMSEPIRQSNGIIDKYIGDTIMAFWGPPFTTATEHPRLACLAALKQIELLKQFETMLPDLPRFNMRIGISTGEVILGSLGSEIARSYTVIGDNVNLASRLESINKYYGTNILICEEVWEVVKDTLECREIDRIRVAGKTHPISIFEVMGEKGQLDDAMVELRHRFAAGLAAYRACKWNDARLEFEKCIALNGQEQAAVAFLSRIESFQKNPPESDWGGIWVFSRK